LRPKGFVESDLSTQLALFEPAAEPPWVPDLGHDEVRRLVPARDDLRPLYVTGFGLSVGKSGEVLQIKEKGKLIQEARLRELDRVKSSREISHGFSRVMNAGRIELPTRSRLQLPRRGRLHIAAGDVNTSAPAGSQRADGCPL
jgi:hypothetical protein